MRYGYLRESILLPEGYKSGMAGEGCPDEKRGRTRIDRDSEGTLLLPFNDEFAQVAVVIPLLPGEGGP